MKKLIALTFFTSLLFSAVSQEKISVNEEKNSLSIGSVNTLTFVVYQMQSDQTEKEWKKFLKSWNGNVKGKKELFADDCLLKSMSENTFDVYSMVKETEGGSKVIAAIDLGGAYLNSSEHSAYYKAMTAELYDFAVEKTKQAISGELKEAENELKDTEKKKANLEKDIENLEKDIEDMKKRIEDNKKSITDKTKEVSDKEKEIEQQKAVVKSIEEKRDAVK